jgi:hypothetical protein
MVSRFIYRCRAPTREDVRNSILNWNSLLDRIKMQEFNPSLPASFTSVSDSTPDLMTPTNKRKADDDGDAKNESEQKRKRTGKGQPTCDEFKLAATDDWRWFLTDQALKSLPNFRDTKVKWCPRIHTKGRCVKDCPNAASHNSASTLPPMTRRSTRAGWTLSAPATPPEGAGRGCGAAGLTQNRPTPSLGPRQSRTGREQL